MLSDGSTWSRVATWAGTDVAVWRLQYEYMFTL
jgi:hypothetical protein